jgi:RNA polymerase sigma factor (sigma-70 family)
MPATPMSDILHHLRSAVQMCDAAGMTDGQLLDCFVGLRDEAAFETIVRRHGPMVWGVCRRVLVGHHDAEDAFQATFLVLVRRAASVVPREMLANWLYGVAHQTALKARANAARCMSHERQVTAMPEPAAREQDLWHDLQGVLDRELSRLPDKYRAAIVLCDVEGKTRSEAARQLGLPEGTLSGHLSRGRTMLARRLTRRGVALSSTVLASMVSQGAAPACVPASVLSSTIQIASLWTAGQTARAGVISASVVALAEGVLKTMLLNKLKTVMAVLLVLGVLLGGTTLARQIQTGEQEKDPKSKPALAERTAAALPEDDVRLKRDHRGLQGTWRLVKLEVNGVELPFAILQPKEGAFAVFVRAKLTINFMETKEYTFKLDPARKPTAIDLHPLEDVKKTLPGIYRLAGDDLTLCFCQGGKQVRPSAFADYWKAGSYIALLVFKRERKPGAAIPKAKADDPAAPPPEVKDLFDPFAADNLPKDPRAREAAKGDRELWAALGVPQPLCRQDEVASKSFAIQFCIVNDSARIVDPRFGSSQLLINGKALKDWPVIIANGPRDNRWKALPPNGRLRFSYGLHDYFKEPGVYKVVWKGKNFQSPEIVFRVEPN